MSLSFLSKKPWHTATVRNVEKVWAAEEKEKEEQRKLEAYRKDIEEERQKAELRQLQEETGRVAKSNRVDWLYETPAPDAKDYLLGKPVELNPEDSDVKKVEHLPGSNFLNGQNNLSNAANEEFNKMTNDPLVMMRAEEQRALQRILNNPLKMKAIKTQAQEAEPERREKKEKRSKKQKHEKKSKRHKTERRGRGESESSGDDGERPSRDARSSAVCASSTSAALPPPQTKAGYGLQCYRSGQKTQTPELGGDRPALTTSAADRAGHSHGDDRSGRAGEGRARVDDALATGQRSHQRSLPISKEERSERLRQMMQDGEQHDLHRRQRSAAERAEHHEEQQLLRRAATSANAVGEGEERPRFLDNMARDVYADGGGDSVAGRISQTKHTMQRGHRASAENFMRR
uniref:CBF1-interacting co-repressor CIR N-terminal domain-containing protein n=1 Tax=Calcidiscus leptoporus TaxID=127549 RepID=A0A6U5MLP7_9EUKA|mmetsp:Transcript_54157/g.124711  ORF Transcript_54157/g.124711 Transcript_54157/m.124711 type:complete len:403 (+) Transcript_54157:23-1231(+)